MPWVTEEEIQAAKNMTAYEYLRTHQAQRLGASINLVPVK